MFPILTKAVDNGVSQVYSFGPFREGTYIRQVHIKMAPPSVSPSYLNILPAVSVRLSNNPIVNAAEFNNLPGPGLSANLPPLMTPFATSLDDFYAALLFEMDFCVDYTCVYPNNYICVFINSGLQLNGFINIYKD